jgi:hypothetical protein
MIGMNIQILGFYIFFYTLTLVCNVSRSYHDKMTCLYFIAYGVQAVQYHLEFSSDAFFF